MSLLRKDREGLLGVFEADRVETSARGNIVKFSEGSRDEIELGSEEGACLKFGVEKMNFPGNCKVHSTVNCGPFRFFNESPK